MQAVPSLGAATFCSTDFGSATGLAEEMHLVQIRTQTKQCGIHKLGEVEDVFQKGRIPFTQNVSTPLAIFAITYAG